MPTATAVFGVFPLTNLGPLTTTFTAAPSCTNLASISDAILVAVPTPSRYDAIECTQKKVSNCQPSGTRRDELQYRGREDLPSSYYVDYFSPGIHCPAGWTTAAVAVGNGESSAGVFTITKDLDDYQLALRAELRNWIDPTETMALCCPSQYQLFGPGLWDCASKVAPLTSGLYKTGCRLDEDKFTPLESTMIVDGVHYVSYATMTGPMPTIRYPLTTESDGTSMDFYATVPAITLVHRQQDLSGAATKTKTATLTGTAGADGPKETKKSNAIKSSPSGLLSLAFFTIVVANLWVV